MRVAESAHKHNVSDEDIHHAIRNAIKLARQDDEFMMIIGPAQDGTFLEIGVLYHSTPDEIVIHAMNCRPTYL